MYEIHPGRLLLRYRRILQYFMQNMERVARNICIFRVFLKIIQKFKIQEQ
jgi:hypothetical protein